VRLVRRSGRKTVPTLQPARRISLRAPRYVRPLSVGTTQRFAGGAVPVAPGPGAGGFVPAGGGGGAGPTLKLVDDWLAPVPGEEPKR